MTPTTGEVAARDDLKRYPLIEPHERLEFQAFKWGLATGFVIGIGVALVIFVASAWVFAHV